jgi:hypothetical protein
METPIDRSFNENDVSFEAPTDKFALLARLDEMKRAIDGYREYKNKTTNSSCNTSQT